MANSNFPHFGAVVRDGVAYSRVGIGETARSGGHAALWVIMRPSTFLSLATPLPVPRSSLGWLLGAVAEGLAIAPPELLVRRGAPCPAVVSHEGRHRANAVLRLAGDGGMPVRIRVQHAGDGEIDAGLAASLRTRLRAQRGGPVVEGPLFGEWEEDLGGRPRSGCPPPARVATFGAACVHAGTPHPA